MKNLIIIIALIAMSVSAGPAEKVRYWYSQNVSETVPPLDDIVQLQDNSDGQGVRYTWLIDNPPSKATIQAIDNATAVAWSLDQRKDKTADYDNWTAREKALIKVLMSEINTLRVKAGLQARTKVQIIEALKTEL